MRRPVIALLLVALVATIGLSPPAASSASAHAEGHDEDLDIYASPDQFNGKRVRVQGPIVTSAPNGDAGSPSAATRSSRRSASRWNDGVIVFPMEIKGQTAIVEGVWRSPP